MSLSEVQFNASCAQWLGDRPCPEQTAQGLNDCTGCERFEPGSVQYAVGSTEPLTRERILEASDITIIEKGGLGSILRATTVTHAIRNLNPGVSFTWLTHQRGAELLKYVPQVQAVDIEGKNYQEYKDALGEGGLVINFECGEEVKEAVANARAVGGFAVSAEGGMYAASEEAQYFLRLQIDDSFREQNELTMQQILLKALGLEDQTTAYDVVLSEENHAQAERLLHEAFGHNETQALIGINLGTSEKGRLRRWPAENYSMLVSGLAEKYPDAGIVVLNGPDDAETLSQFVTATSQLPSNAKIMPANLEVGDFVALTGRMDVVVTSDTFGFHACKSQNVPTAVLVGPVPHREVEVSPEDILIGPKLSCAPCYHNCTQPVKGKCMSDISVDEVGAAVSTMLDRHALAVGTSVY